MQVSLALKKLGRKLEAEQRAQGESGVSGCMVRAATISELFAVTGKEKYR